jgi:hypothetical protein
MNRRTFSAIAFAAAVTRAPFARAISAAPASGTSLVDVAAVDRTRILTAANAYLKQQPVTITSSTSPRSPGGPHDYFSEGDYWWPNPANPDGPYIQRDGFSNPANFNAHREALIRLSIQVPRWSPHGSLPASASTPRTPQSICVHGSSTQPPS